MEARWHGKTYEEALAYAVPEGVDLDAYDAEKCAALLAAYYDYWGPREDTAKIWPEFRVGPRPLEGTEFVVDGMMDGLGTLQDGRAVIVESKTCSESLDHDSRYWDRLRFNVQILHYASEAREKGHDVTVIYYDVTRKPSFKPKQVSDLDEDGKKIVNDAEGNRVFIEKGKKGEKRKEPRQTGSEELGYVIQTHLETPSEYSNRLYQDIMRRPEFYFARREVPVIDDQLDALKEHRFVIARMIENFRDIEMGQMRGPRFKRNPNRWPRNVSKDTCNFCQYSSFCLQGISVNLDYPPAGFEVRPFNPELRETNYDDTSEETDAATN
jgi:hypothetical protein